jgi:hypothetical protein
MIPAPDLLGELPPEVRFASGAIVVYQLAFLYRFEQGIDLYTVTAIFKAAGVCMAGPRLIESLPPTERCSTSLSCGWYFFPLQNQQLYGTSYRFVSFALAGQLGWQG